MRPDTAIVVISVLILASVPFVFWGILVLIARIWKPNMRFTLPWLRAFRWLVWLLGMMLASIVLAMPHRYFWLFAIGMSTASIGSGWHLLSDG
jgi:hypothetical protein